MPELLAVVLPPARVVLARGWSMTSTSTSVPDDILALFLEGAAAAVALATVDVFELPAALGFVLGFSVWPFRFLISGIVFDGSMSAN